MNSLPLFAPSSTNPLKETFALPGEDAPRGLLPRLTSRAVTVERCVK